MVLFCRVNLVSTKTKILIFMVIIAIVMVVQFLLPGLGQSHSSRLESTGNGVSYSFDDSPSFHSNQGNFFFATRNGISGYTSSADVRWRHSFNFTRPVMVARGDIVAVGEQQGGRRIYVFNNDGFLFDVELDHPITTFSVNETGFLAVVVQYATGHGIQVFNRHSSNAPLYSRDIVETLVFPTAVEISVSGRHIAVAMLDLNTRLNTVLEFGYINQADGFATGNRYGTFSAVELRGQVVYGMRFMEDNKLVVATTSQIIGYQITSRSYAVSTQSQVWHEELQNSLSHIYFYNNRYFAYVTGDRNLGQADAPAVGTVRVMQADGSEVGTFATGRRVTHFSMGSDAFLVGADRNFNAVDLRGNHLWEHNILYDVRGRDVIFVGDTNTVLIAGATRAEIYERTRVRVDEFEFY